MESFFSSIDYKDPVWIAIAFLLGTLSRSLRLPPLVGFLVAGFVLNFSGITGGHFLNEMADLGITLLLFTIGLKLKIKELLKVEIWGSALVHILLFSMISAIALYAVKQLNIPLFNQLSVVNILIISFALSFSSTVFAVKTLDEQGDFLSRFGQISIGILIIQDLVVVLYIGASATKTPSIWAISLIILLFVLRPLIVKLSTKVGHGELLLLFGLSMALGGSVLFEAVDMKADLGSLVFGMLLANTPKADELSKSLLSVKDLFLLGFFLSIGMTALPDMTTFVVVSILSILIIFKGGLFFWILSKFKEHTFPATKASLLLSNFSEFGLIVIVIAVSQHWLSNEWLVAFAVLIAVSFVFSAIFNKYSNFLYYRLQHRLEKLQHHSIDEDESRINVTGIELLICGMGRMGDGVYDQLYNSYNLIGLDYDKDVVKAQLNRGRKVYFADVSSSDFWSEMDISTSSLKGVILCTPNVDTNKTAAELARNWGFKHYICATSFYADEQKELIDSGINSVLNVYVEAGVGLALKSQKALNKIRL